MYRCELRITEDAAGDVVRVLAPSEPEDLRVSAQACAEQHLLAELQGRWVVQSNLPFRVEVRVWEGEASGPPAAIAAWESTTGFATPYQAA